VSPPATVVMSIHPHHARRIYEGVKPFEFRRSGVRIQPGDVVLIYETAPVSAVTGQARVEAVVKGNVASLSSLESSLDERSHVERYLSGAVNPTALRLCDIAQYRTARDLPSLGIRRPPQSYQFVRPNG
jgi:predicted transcriptional regulator